jgi:hypothetical protein
VGVGFAVDGADDEDGEGSGGVVAFGSGDSETDGSGSGSGDSETDGSGDNETDGSGDSETDGSGDSETSGKGSGAATVGVAIVGSDVEGSETEGAGSETWPGTSTAAAAAAYDPSTAISPQHTAAMAARLRCPPISPSFAAAFRGVAGFTSEIDGWSSRE